MARRPATGDRVALGRVSPSLNDLQNIVELIDNNGRVIPGDGSAPIVAILRKLVEKRYSGPLSVELFLMELQQGDPFDVATRIKQKAEAVMRQAGVL